MKLKKALEQQKDSTEQVHTYIAGILGIPLNGRRQVEVQGRNSFLYVRLRNNQSEVIQAFNNQVSPSYNLPVLVERQGNRYVVVSVDTQRYGDNWTNFSPFLPRHGNTHSFDLESGGGGDVVWVQSRQIVPLLAMPSGSDGGPNVIINPYTLKNSDGTWKYIGNTGTQNLTPYNPSSPTGAIMVLVYADSVSGNPYILVGSGTVFSNAITGTSQIPAYVPSITNPAHIPLAAVRLITGSNVLSWNNIYDVRQWLHTTPTGTGGGSSSGLDTLGFAGLDEGIPLGTGTSLNVVGSGATFTRSGTMFNLNIPGASAFTGDANSVVLTDGAGALDTMPWLKWGTSSQEFIEFGADEVKEVNAGKMGYNAFGDGYFDIIGAGTTGSISRTVQIYDRLRVSDTIDARFMNIASDGDYNRDGVPHVHVGTFTVQDEGIPVGTGTFLNFVGANVSASISGSVVKVSVAGVEEAPIDGDSYVRNNAAWSPVFTDQTIQDEGSQIGFAGTFNFVGTNVDVSISGSTARVFSNNELIGFKSYLGGDKTTITGSMVDADAVNLAVTFTAPATARVLVRLTAQSSPDTGAAVAGNQHQWGLREGSTAIAGPHTVSRDVTANGFAVFVAATAAFVITGTSAGSHTYKWGHLSSAGGTVRIGASATNGPAVMEVWSLP